MNRPKADTHQFPHGETNSIHHAAYNAVATFVEGDFHGAVVADPLPAGFEIDNPNLMSSGTEALSELNLETEVAHSEFRQDRFLTALDWSSSDSFRLSYIVRAVSPGTFHHPAASVEDMYRPDFRARSDVGTVTIGG